MTRVRRGLFGFLIAVIIPACGGGSNSKAASTIPSAPTTLTATVQTSARIDLTWVDTANNEFEFRIERADAPGGPYVQIATVAMNLQGYTDLGLQANKAYYYQVAAWNGKGLSAFAGPATATTNPLSWTNATITGGAIPARANHTAIYDAIGTRMVVYGGWDDLFMVFDDVWSFDLSSAANGSVPCALETTSGIATPFRTGHSAVYDSANRRMIVFGGQDDVLAYRNEVFVLNLATMEWTQPPTTGTPPSIRALHSAVYDSTRQQMIVFGGTDGSAFDFQDVHMLSLPAAGAFAWSSPAVGSRPVRRSQHAAIYDPIGARKVVFGGFDQDATGDGSSLNSETWTFLPANPGSWNQLVFPTTPGFTMGHSSVYDAANQRKVIFAGANSSTTQTNQMWAMRLDVAPTWSILNPSSGGPPPARASHSAVYDTTHRRMVVYGGFDGLLTAMGDLWIVPF